MFSQFTYPMFYLVFYICLCEQIPLKGCVFFFLHWETKIKMPTASMWKEYFYVFYYMDLNLVSNILSRAIAYDILYSMYYWWKLTSKIFYFYEFDVVMQTRLLQCLVAENKVQSPNNHAVFRKSRKSFTNYLLQLWIPNKEGLKWTSFTQ